MHLLWTERLGQDSPKTAVDYALERKNVNLSDSDGMTFTNGAPGTEAWSTVSDNDFGIVMANRTLHQFDGTKAVLMHEIGHALGIGYADDDLIGVSDIGIQRGLEAYSGDVSGAYIGVDETPERVNRNGEFTWSLMKRGVATDWSQRQYAILRFAFSIEELSTIDFKHVPSRKD